MKSSASESKRFQSRSKGEISGRARRKERLSSSKLKQASLIQTQNFLFLWVPLKKVRSLNQASLGLLQEPNSARVPLVSIILEARNDRNIILGLWCYLSGIICHLLGQNT